jgi:uncharacterized repeat protein (TIGR01451 family)
VRLSFCIAAVLVLSCVPSAQASVTLGSTAGATDSCGTDQVQVQSTTAAGGPSYVAEQAGVVVSWSYLAHSGTPSIRFKVYKPTASANTWFLRTQSAVKTFGAGADQAHTNQLNTFAESPGLRIEAGDHLGLTATGDGTMGCIGTSSASDVRRVKNPPDSAPGVDTAGFNGNDANFKLDVSAVVEPDADGDGFGDETQDSCPTDATVQTGACPVEVSLAKTVSDGAKEGSDLTYTLAVKNNNATNPAGGVSVIDPLPAGVVFVSSAAGQGSCAGDTNVTCALGTLGPGASTSVTIVVRPTQPGPLSNTASVTTTSSDTDTSNNSSTAATNVTPLPPILSAFKLKPTSFKAKAGTLVTYQLTEDATTSFTVFKRAAGVKKAGRCVKPPKKKKKGKKKPKRCTRLIQLNNKFTRADLRGPVSFSFKPRLKGKPLAPGSYRLRAVASNVSGASKAANADFKIKK